MTEHMQGEFIAKIIETLSKNGFPDKRVALPLEKMYESAANKGIHFNRILEFLEQHEGIFHKKEGDRIIFSSSSFVEPSHSDNSNFGGFDALKNMDMGAMMGQVQKMMQQMSPEQLAQAQEMAKNLSPDQMSKFSDMFKSMSPEQLKELKEQAEAFMKKD